MTEINKHEPIWRIIADPVDLAEGDAYLQELERLNNERRALQFQVDVEESLSIQNETGQWPKS